ncbi:MAG TPA: hypothetical protein VJV78_06445 [Polyangiales bacterium]|nr:hypothetical protein [Polyangiales bacterium]
MDSGHSDLRIEPVNENDVRLKPYVPSSGKYVICPMPPFNVRFRFRFDKTSGKAPPKHYEKCRIGIVQNVLYEKVSISFENGLTREKTYDDPDKKKVQVLDCGDDEARPFANSIGTVTRRVSSDAKIYETHLVKPYQWISYGPNGFGLLTEGGVASDKVELTRYADVELWDQPFLQAHKMTGDKARQAPTKLVKVMQRLDFGLWLVLLHPGELPELIAFTDTFYMRYDGTLEWQQEKQDPKRPSDFSGATPQSTVLPTHTNGKFSGGKLLSPKLPKKYLEAGWKIDPGGLQAYPLGDGIMPPISPVLTGPTETERENAWREYNRNL